MEGLENVKYYPKENMGFFMEYFHQKYTGRQTVRVYKNYINS